MGEDICFASQIILDSYRIVGRA